MSDTPHCYRHPGRETLVSCSECGRPICEDCMHFAPVGIRCPDHANIGAVKPRPQQSAVNVRRRVGALAAPATAVLITINVAIYLVTVVQGAGLNGPGGALFERWFLVGALVDSGEWWRLVTAMFLHGSLIHLGFNMLALYWLGSVVEQLLGTPRYLLLYFVSGLAGSAGALVSSSAFQPTVGASGAIYGVLGALLILEYRSTGTFAGPALTLIVINLAFTFAIPGISWGGHLGGLAGGILATFVLDESRRRRIPALGAVVVIGIGIASVVIAYARVRSYPI